jgi:sterol 14-demethylase
MNALSELWTETGATPILVSVLLLLPIAYLVISHLSSRDEPPTVWYWIPWVGSALSLGKDPDAFFDWAT